jgi:hypothetical protein
VKNIKHLTIIAITILLIVGCNAAAGEKGAKPSPDWSRSVPLGQSAIGSIGFALDEDAREIHAAWPAEDGSIYYRRFTTAGELLLSNDLNFTGQLRMPRLAVADRHQLHFIYSSRLSGGQVWQLWYSQIGDDGELVGQPVRISAAEMNVGDFSIAPDQQGGVLVSWNTRLDGNLYLLHLDAGGNVKSGPHKIAGQGESPTTFVGPDGMVYLSWISDANILYNEIPLDQLSTAEGVHVVDLKIGTGDSLSGPVIGVSDGWVYIMWSILSQSGLEAGSAHASYVSFPVGEASYEQDKPIWISPEEDQIYSPYQGSLPLTQLADPPQTAIGTSDFIMRPDAVKEVGSEMVAALVARQNLRMNNQLQIATIVLDQGEYQGYAFASKTQQISDNPVIALDSLGSIFLVWRDGIARQNVYYATTNSDAILSIDRLNSTDIVNALLEGGTESLIGIAFMPFIGLGWMLPGLLIMGIWKMFKDQETVDEPQSWIPLIISVIIYYATKTATLPTMMTYVPFSAWIYIPVNWEMVLRIGVPIVIFVIAIFVAHYVRVRYSDSTVVYYISLVLTDALLTLAIYGVNFLGVF